MWRKIAVWVGLVGVLIGGGLTGLKLLPKKEWVGPKHTVAVVAIDTAPKNLWDEEIGIYVKGNHDNYLQKGKVWERPAEIKFYEVDGKLVFENKIGLRLHGEGTRLMPQKSFRVYFKEVEGGAGIISYPVFGAEGSKRYASLVLRPGDNQETMIRDELASRLVRQNSDIDVRLARPVAVYLNGEYWGLYFLQERFDQAYFRERYGASSNLLDLVEVVLASGENKGLAVVDKELNNQVAVEEYNQLLAKVRECHGCFGYYSLDGIVDLTNLRDYLVWEMFFGNADWPYNNTRAWRYKKEGKGELDGRWRWLLFDLDAGMGEAAVNPYDQLVDEAFPLRNLFYDPNFISGYSRRVEELFGGKFRGEELAAEVDSLAAEVRPEMARQIERWGNQVADDGSHGVGSLDEWERQIELLKVFLSNRPEEFVSLTKSFAAGV
ncbi:MAG: hypothetical protein UX85_C0004G0190 [Candidatus Beckwithbacteria bacterium GW2011_GWB1_47_15]|uniref:Spore coat protein CotH n=1 Tax=Candidatus Beckwithbacteria bacterium GW2011_GWB1_47_15 TaxID=1618371 RepID=A0A0G1U4M6_9BACT|nr:MAG: putative lipoprotein [Candidatus Beckwithbacteria bacterium GW2011_GWC1_49_16]KKU34987.1 MAG: hypothetical protein UX50_C0007G0022 [Candidatus Beckwithbacteria bacterium GW2011_GWA1_46_30]KKU61268.1 MAG: hypothetical protein UX85_C0004G0190 [Candidatus Beckwithbacteria bacterium GW2011_GWB1_47_15]KKU71438.1 MAG: hypothetical protein UX97_C0006G0022 [Candidatus Beckwithbacteria bacterium GW2011_GWA2_47_25]KKW03074.1 MAG: hypothetical protein UY37_C0007G0028 [Candidatus Beckwithbacteria b